MLTKYTDLAYFLNERARYLERNTLNNAREKKIFKDAFLRGFHAALEATNRRDDSWERSWNDLHLQ